MLRETGFCNGVENYSRHLALRDAGETPSCLIDFFPKDFLLVVDESHVTLPQVRGMYNGDRMRKQTLVDYGFRLPSALDNRPLKFEEFEEKINQAIYVSATPGDYELERTNNKYVEQIIRPTGLLDPIIEVLETPKGRNEYIKYGNAFLEANAEMLAKEYPTKRVSFPRKYVDNIHELFGFTVKSLKDINYEEDKIICEES